MADIKHTVNIVDNAGRRMLMDGTGAWFCGGDEGCGAYLKDWAKHEFWHQDMELRLLQIRRAVDTVNREEAL